MKRFYIFSHYINGTPVLERSVPIDCEYRAKQRVQELKDWYNYTEAYYTSECPKNYWW
jgi:hypothetical protein